MVGAINEFISALAAQAEKAILCEDGDYIGEDGLLYCGKCNTAKQCVPVPEKPEFRPHCLCKCGLEKQMAEKQQRKKEDYLAAIDRNRKAGISDRKILDFTFENDRFPDSDISVKLRKYCAEWEKAAENNLGLLLWGNCGVGKTFYAGCIANKLIDKGVRVLCTSIPKIINGLYASENKNEYIGNIVEYPFLVIDDFGTERNTGYALEQIFTLIDERYKSNKPTIITTNLNPEEMRRTNGIEQKRIYSRIIEMCVPICVNGNPQRMKAAISKAELLSDILKT